MFQLAGTATVSAVLLQARDQLRFVSAQVADAVQAAPRREASGWDGLAASAYQRSLEHLCRELEGAQELLRSATDSISAALFELDGHA